MPYCLACSSCSVNKTKRDQYTVQKRVRLGSGYVIYATQPKPLLLRFFLFLFVLLTERVEQATWKKWQEREAFSLSRRTLRQLRVVFLLQRKNSQTGWEFWLSIRTDCFEISDFLIVIIDLKFVSQITDLDFVSFSKFAVILSRSFWGYGWPSSVVPNLAKVRQHFVWTQQFLITSTL